MNPAKVGRLLRHTLRRPGLLVPGRLGFLFLMSHMRSYSSLLAHILGSHPEISGHRERLQSTVTARDLWRWRLAEIAESGEPGRRFLLDKVLHDEYRVSDGVLARTDVRIVVFVRRPESALRSIDRLGRDLLADARYCDPASNVEYYCGRLETLRGAARRSAVPPIYFDAESIVEDTEALLAGLGRGLGLETPLTPEYSVFPDSGRPLLGDPSRFIRTGHVVRERAEAGGDAPEIPTALLERAQRAYAECPADLPRYRPSELGG